MGWLKGVAIISKWKWFDGPQFGVRSQSFKLYNCDLLRGQKPLKKFSFCFLTTIFYLGLLFICLAYMEAKTIMYELFEWINDRFNNYICSLTCNNTNNTKNSWSQERWLQIMRRNSIQFTVVFLLTSWFVFMENHILRHTICCKLDLIFHGKIREPTKTDIDQMQFLHV